MSEARWTQSPRDMRSWEAFEKSLRNYEWLKDAVPGAMDLDFLIERRGRFLVLEMKPWIKGVNVGFGQHLALEALAKVESFDVYLIGEVERTGALYRCRYGERDPIKNRTRPVWFPPRRFERMSRDSLRLFVQEWFQQASEAA